MASHASVGTDENVSAAKIAPLESAAKAGVPHARGDGGVAGTEADIDQSRISPLGGRGQHRHPEPHADSQGVVGTDTAIGKSKIEPLDGKGHLAQSGAEGLSDEAVDTARIKPLGEVRE